MDSSSKICKLAYSQYGIYLSCIAEPDSLRYNIPILISFPKTIPLNVISQSVCSTINAHPSLFNAIYQNGSEVYMAIAKEEWGIKKINISRENNINDLIDQLTQPFHFNGELLIRVYIVTADDQYYVFMDIHHIICDGVSLNIIIKDLCNAIDGHQIEPETAKFNDFVKEYPVTCSNSHDTLCPETLELPNSKYANGDITEYKVQVFNFSDIDIIRKCKIRKCSPTALTMSALMLALSRFSHSNSVAITGLSSGREDHKYTSTTGMFVNTFPVIHTFNKENVWNFINNIRNAYIKGREQKEYQLNAIKPEILFAYQVGVVDKYYKYNVAAGDIDFKLSLKDGLEFKITIWVVERDGRPAIQIKYNTKDYDDSYIEAFANSIILISEQFIENLDKCIDDIQTVKDIEESTLLSLGKGEDLGYDESLTLVDLFARQVSRTPNNIAVVDATRAYTYQEIDQLSSKMAVYLANNYMLESEEAIGVMTGRSAYMVIYPLAIMKVGCTYVPLDYEHIPDERLGRMCSNAGVRIILTDSSDRVSQHFPAYNGAICEGMPEVNDNMAFNCNITPHNRFVILYTSGSTGDPKGCELEHRGIVNFCHWYAKEFGLTQKDRVLAYANFGFDAHMMDIYPALSVGASVYILTDEIRLNLEQMNQYMEDNDINVAFLTTRVGHLFVSEIENHSLRLLSVSGEKLSPLRKPHYKLYNAGAPTECTIYAFFYEITEEYYERPIIGKALANCQLFVVDKSLNLVPKGVAGELLIGGRGVGRGYLGRPDLTAEKFINFRGERVYKTGDLVRWNSDGLLEYIGRIDNQVKIRGFRIELSEIENKASQISGLRQVCVDVKKIGQEEKIVCYYVSEDGTDKETLIQSSLEVVLPNYMLPDFYIKLESLQLNANGKINRNNLPLPTIQQGNGIQITNNLEKTIISALGLEANISYDLTCPIERFNVKSINLMTLSSKIYRLYGIETFKAKPLSTKSSIIEIENSILERLLDYHSHNVDTKNQDSLSFPLTAQQIGICYDSLINPGTLLYNIPIRLEVSGTNVDEKRIQESLEKCVNQFSILNSRITHTEQGTIITNIKTNVVINSMHCLESELDSTINNLIVPFNITNGPLYRLYIISTESKKYILLDFHHLVFDGRSKEIFIDRFASIYQGICNISKYTSYNEYAIYQRNNPNIYEANLSYFIDAANNTGILKPTEIKPDLWIEDKKHPNHSIVKYIDKDLLNSHRRCDKYFWLAILNLVLYRFTLNKQIHITVTCNGRTSGKYWNTLGMFVNTIPYCGEISDCTLEEYLGYIESRYDDITAHQDLNYADYVSKTSIHPSINFCFQDYEAEYFKYDDLSIIAKTIDTNTNKFKLNVLVEEEKSGYKINFQYDSGIYSETLIKSFAESFCHVAITINSCQENPSIYALSICSNRQLERINAFSRGPAVDIPVELFHKGISRWAKTKPDKVAVICSDRQLTYKELEETTNNLASYLINEGVSKGDRIILYLSRNSKFILSAIAVMKAGGTYIPVDTLTPQKRLEYIYNNSNAKYLITTTQHEVPACCNKIYFESYNSEVRYFENLAEINIEPNDACYIIYTSGTTGNPKGVIISHHNACNFFTKHQANPISLVASEVGAITLCQTSVSFDLSVFEYGTPLFNGQTVAFADESCALDFYKQLEFCKKHNVNTISGTPSRIQASIMLPEYRVMMTEQICSVMLGGEKLPNNLLKDLLTLNVKVVNGYGPTETTMGSSGAILKDSSLITVGRPNPNYVYYIIDEHINKLPEGAVGELIIGGDGVALGYIENSAEDSRFIHINGIRYYRTGDLARLTYDGEIEILGRGDRQVKTYGGVRTELAEIELAITAIPSISQCVAILQEEKEGKPRLVAFYTTYNGTPLSEDEIYSSLAEYLSPYNMPNNVIWMKNMPVTTSGKLDYRFLHNYNLSPLIITEPENELEVGIYDILQQILPNKDFGVTTNLCAIGLHSLEAMLLSAKIQAAYNIELSQYVLLKNSSVRSICSLIQKSKNESHEYCTSYSPGELFQITSSQKGIFLEQFKKPDSNAYNVPIVIDLPNMEDIEHLRASICATLKQYPILLSRIIKNADGIFIEYPSKQDPDITYAQLDKCSYDKFIENFNKPFDLLSESLYRIGIVRYKKLQIFLNFHHIIFDGISESVLLRNLLSKISQINNESLSYLNLHYFSFLREQESYRKSNSHLLDEEFFKNYVKDVTCYTSLPYSHIKESLHDRAEISIPVRVVENPITLKEGISNFNHWLGSVCLALSIYSRSERIAIATISNGRNSNYIESIGMFVNTLPFILDIDRENTAISFLNNVCDNILNVLAHERYSISEVISNSHHSSPQILFSYNIGINDKKLMLNDEPISVHIIPSQNTKFEILISVQILNENMCLCIEYDSSKYSATYIREFADAINNISYQLANNPQLRLNEISLLTDIEESTLLSLGKGEDLGYDESLTLVDLFARQVSRTPNNIAVVDATRAYTYQEIDQLSSKMAVYLANNYMLESEEAIGVMTGRSAYMVIYPLAIMKVGCTYVPLDYEHIPDERLGRMCSNAGVRIILTDSSDRVSQHFPAYNGAICEGMPEVNDNMAFNCNITPHNRFVILYTSGSTGDPKGCELEHRGIVNFCHWYAKEFGLTQKDRVLAYANFGFDAHMMDIYPALSVGASVYILTDEIRLNLEQMNQYMEDNDINVAFLTTRVGHLFVSEIENHSLRLLSVSGEKLSPLRKPHYKLYNAGAPTECTIYAFFYEITEEYYERPIIGKALANCQLFVVDKSLNLVPKGVAGELLIGGRGVGRGYLGRPDLTAEKFINFRGERVYKTGDLVRWNSDGLLEYIGRIDNQVKIRGFRIELSEIENKASQISGLRQVCVDVKKIGQEEKIVCYYVSEDGTDKETLIQSSLEVVLPNYMLPDFYIKLESLQLNANGKADKRNLPIPEIHSLYVPPTNMVESTICSIFSEILNIQSIGIDDDFSKLGGSSIMALDVLLKLEKLGYGVSYTDLMTYRTPRLLSQFLTGVIIESVKEFEYDATAIGALLNSQSFNVDLEGIKCFEPDIYIITGVTGFLGMHILHELIHTTERLIICTVRGKDYESGQKYFWEKYNYYFDTYDISLNNRIILVNGDLKDSSTYIKLENFVNIYPHCTLYNCAANVRHFSAENQIEHDNIAITNNIIEFCIKMGIHLVHMSSISVSGTANITKSHNIVFTERELNVEQSLKNEYVRSKYLSEYSILMAIYYKNLSANIMRLGNLGPRFTDGLCQENISSNAFMNKLKSFWMLTKCPMLEYYNTYEISPIDYVAKSIFVLSHLKTNCIIYHPICNNNILLRDIIKVMNANDLFVTPIDTCEFNIIKNEAGTSEMFSLFAYNYHNHEPLPINNDSTTYLLHRAGFKWPILDSEYLNRFIKFLIDLNYFSTK